MQSRDQLAMQLIMIIICQCHRYCIQTGVRMCSALLLHFQTPVTSAVQLPVLLTSQLWGQVMTAAVQQQAAADTHTHVITINSGRDLVSISSRSPVLAWTDSTLYCSTTDLCPMCMSAVCLQRLAVKHLKQALCTALVSSSGTHQHQAPAPLNLSNNCQVIDGHTYCV